MNEPVWYGESLVEAGNRQAEDDAYEALEARACEEFLADTRRHCPVCRDIRWAGGGLAKVSVWIYLG